MKIIQRRYLKFLSIVIFLTVSTFHLSMAQISGFRLKTADSLYLTKRYTQSLDHYEQILKQGQYSPAMFLKMAFIHEGLNEIGSAMYYLNLYNIATNDKLVLEKMAELAIKFNLEGYETTDTDRFLSFYVDHRIDITLALTALVILFLSAMYFTRMRLHRRPLASGIGVIVFLSALFVHQHYGSNMNRGIISNPATYLMDGPSAGASVIRIIGDGHRVEVVGRKDVWMKIRWKDDVAYVKQNSLRPVRL
ncbi:MAG: hypothetical protein ABIR06_13590 [Cyclobacteriaceae bacterium]